MDLSKTLRWRDGNANADANANDKVTTIALPVLCTGELKNVYRTLKNQINQSNSHYECFSKY